MKTLGQSKKGQEHENQDAFHEAKEVLSNGEEACLLAVADGVTQCAYGGSVARWFIAALRSLGVAGAVQLVESGMLEKWVQDQQDRFREEFNRDPDWMSSGCAITLAVVHGGLADIFWAGDAPAFLTRRDETAWKTDRLTTPDIDVYRHVTNLFSGLTPTTVHHVRSPISPGDLVTLASDGFAAVWDPGSLSEAYRNIAFGPVLAEHLVSQPFRDDATFVCVIC